MMSILFKGVEMPKGCWDCPFQTNPICATNDILNFTTRIARPDNCPLIEVSEDVQLVKWIPFSVRDLDEEEKAEHPEWDCILDGELPEDGQRILVNVKFKGHESVQMDEFYSDCDGSYLDSGYEIGTEVTHWMPLPEPPKEE